MSIEEFKAGIEVSRLPKTFQDAISVVRKLGERYLWIDSICIVQNSTDDWNAESILMDEVYGHALCTLAATSATDGNGGLIHGRHPSQVNMPEVSSVWNESENESWAVLPLDFWRVNVTDAPLNRRAWVLQERVLSKRVVHFGQNQILWECNTLDCCETFPDGLPPLIQSIETHVKGLDIDADGTSLIERVNESIRERKKERVHPTTDEIQESEDEAPLQIQSLSLETDDEHATNESSESTGKSSLTEKQDSLETDVLDQVRATEMGGYFLWSRLISKYSTCKLTRGEDKLIAISGIAKQMKQILNDEYLSGLWKNILPSQLLWTVEDYIDSTLFFASMEDAENNVLKHPPKLEVKRSESQKAPTWSWASIDGAIAPPFPYKDPGLIDLIGVMVDDELTQGPFPNVTNLFLNCSLHFGRILFHPVTRNWTASIQPQGIHMCEPAMSQFADKTFISTEIQKTSMSNTSIAIVYLDVDLEPTKSHFAVFLPVMKRTRRKALREDNMRTDIELISGLALEPDQYQGRYKRIGCFDIMRDGDKPFGSELSNFEGYSGLFLKDSVIAIS